MHERKVTSMLAGIFAIVSSISVVFGVDDAPTKLEKLHQLSRQIEQSQAIAYGSIHCKFSVSVEVSGNQEMFGVEYWSRDKKYFRVDETKSGNDIIESRLIVRPEGFVRLQRGADDKLAVVNFGTNHDGMSILYSYSFFRAGETLGFGPKLGVVVDDIRRTDSIPVWKFTSLATKSSTLTEVELKLQEFTWKAEIDSRSNAIVGISNLSSKCSREFSPSGVLMSSICTRLNSGAKTLEEKLTLKTIEQIVVPLGVFSLDSQGVSRGDFWVRRMVIFGSAVVFVSVYFAYRRLRKNHA